MGVSYVPVARPDEIAPGAIKEVDMGGRRLLLANVDGAYYAYAGDCPHEGADLAVDGRIEGTLIHCDGHNYCYDLASGACVAPAGGPTLAVLPVEERDGELCIRFEW